MCVRWTTLTGWGAMPFDDGALDVDGNLRYLLDSIERGSGLLSAINSAKEGSVTPLVFWGDECVREAGIVMCSVVDVFP